MAIHFEYLSIDPRPEVNAEFIIGVANSYYPEIQRILSMFDTPNAEEAYNQMIEAAKMTAKTNSASTSMNPSEYIQKKYSDERTEDIRVLHDNVIRNIMITCQTNNEVYTLKRIEGAVDYVMGLKKNANATEHELSSAAYAKLKKGPSDKRRSFKKKAVMDDTHIEIQNRLLGSC